MHIESLLMHWLYLYYFTSFTNSSVMQGYHTQLDNVCIARLRLYSRRTRISTNTRTIFTFCILKLQTSGIYIIKHENENLKLIMYIVANVLASFSGERSVCKVLVRKGHLCFMGFVVVHEDGDKGLETSTDKYFRATKSKTMPYMWKAERVLRWTEARIRSMKKINRKTWKQHVTARVWQETNLSSDFPSERSCLAVIFHMKFISTLISSFKRSEAFLRFYGTQIWIS